MKSDRYSWKIYFSMNFPDWILEMFVIAVHFHDVYALFLHKGPVIHQ